MASTAHSNGAAPIPRAQLDWRASQRGRESKLTALPSPGHEETADQVVGRRTSRRCRSSIESPLYQRITRFVANGSWSLRLRFRLSKRVTYGARARVRRCARSSVDRPCARWFSSNRASHGPNRQPRRRSTTPLVRRQPRRRAHGHVGAKPQDLLYAGLCSSLALAGAIDFGQGIPPSVNPPGMESARRLDGAQASRPWTNERLSYPRNLCGPANRSSSWFPPRKRGPWLSWKGLPSRSAAIGLATLGQLQNRSCLIVGR
jgi:hypothetical protein